MFWLAGQVLAHRRDGLTVDSGLRLADFAGVVKAVALAEGWANEVPALLAGVETAQLRLLAAGDDVIAALIDYAERPTKPLQGLRAGELLEELRSIRPQIADTTAAKLAATLKKRRGALTWVGIEINTAWDAHARARLYTVEVAGHGPAEVAGSS